MVEISTLNMHFHAKEVVLYQFEKTKVRNITATLLSQICEVVEIESTSIDSTGNSFTQELQTHQRNLD